MRKITDSYEYGDCNFKKTTIKIEDARAKKLYIDFFVDHPISD